MTPQILFPPPFEKNTFDRITDPHTPITAAFSNREAPPTVPESAWEQQSAPDILTLSASVLEIKAAHIEMPFRSLLSALLSAESPQTKWRIEIGQELTKIRKEAETDNPPVVILESTYNHTFHFLSNYCRHVPMPHITWGEKDIGLEWWTDDGIATVSIFEDETIIYGISINKHLAVDGICSIHDSSFLRGFMATLEELL